ncbi:MAG TPA: hypothetical protein VJT82_07050 [Pyrinomonadaceae bacterium]|nr:hypothetical protein [Pyrinomonadaceae bacterium]
MTDSNNALAFFDNTTPGAAGWLVLFVWFAAFVLVVGTFLFILRRLFRRWRAGAVARHGGKQV